MLSKRESRGDEKSENIGRVLEWVGATSLEQLGN